MFYFPADLPRMIARSFALRFVLQAMLECDEEKFCFYSKILVQASQAPMQRTWETMLVLLDEMKEDENLWVYLLENRGALNDYFGALAIDALFQKWFTKGKESFIQALFDQLDKRGFVHLFSTLTSKIEAIQWTSSS